VWVALFGERDAQPIAVDDGKTFVGDVYAVGPVSGSFAAFRRASVAPVRADPDVSGGDVGAIVDDGAGGWVLGGTFTTVGGVACRGFAHLTAVHRLDRRLCLGVKGAVSALARRGSTVYLAGMFTRVGREWRSKLAAVDLRSGRVLPWTATIGGRQFYDEGGGRHDLVPRRVNDLAVLGKTVYIGGYFEKIGGKRRENVAALDASSGRVLDWRADAGEVWASADLDYVSVLEAVPGRLYMAGNFRKISGAARDGIGAVDPATGRVIDWRVRAPAQFIHGHDSGPYDMTAAAGRLYVAGRFEWRNTTPQLVVIDADTGRARADGRFSGAGPDDWSHGAADVYSLAADAQHLYVGGNFDALDGGPRASLVAIDLRTDKLLPWRPAAVGVVNALAARDGVVAAGGGFSGIATGLRDGLASFDLRTGRLLRWRPRLTPKPDEFGFSTFSRVSALAADGSMLYLGGSFVAVNGQPRYGLAAFDLTTGELTDWAPALGGPERLDPIDAMAVADGMVYIGGSFSSVNGEHRAGFAAIDASTGELRDWNPGAEDPEYNSVYAVAPADGLVYVTALEFDGNPAASDVESNEWLSWEPTMGGHYGFASAVVVLYHDGRLYVGGDFDSFDGYPRRGLVALDPETREVLPFHAPPLEIGLDAYPLAASDELLAVVEPSGKPTLLAAATGRRLPWVPRGDPSLGECGSVALNIEALVAMCGGRVLFFTRQGSS
jgi:hypothetical protein